VPNVTTILVRCYECDHTWHQRLQIGIIGAVNGDTITVLPRAINVECPECGAKVVNHTATTVNVTGETIRGFFALLRSLTSADLKEIARIAAEASENEASAEAVAERIKASIPSLRPVLARLNSPQGTQWITILLVLVQIALSVTGVGSTPPAVQRPVIIIESPSGEEQQTNDLLRQIVEELRSALNASEAADTGNQDQGNRSRHH
jgi:hypothetical protein